MPAIYWDFVAPDGSVSERQEFAANSHAQLLQYLASMLNNIQENTITNVRIYS
jgi:hypothetical protein